MRVKRAQTDSFMKEKADLMGKGSLSNYSSLPSLKPFLHGNQLLKVGSRIENADLFDHQHPLILPKAHYITTLIIEDIHNKNTCKWSIIIISRKAEILDS
jgi:hypothetical protein